MNTADNAPTDRPILVWVREANRDGTGAWRPGRAWKAEGTLPPRLIAEGYNGDWSIPTWTEFPPAPEGYFCRRRRRSHRTGFGGLHCDADAGEPRELLAMRQCEQIMAGLNDAERYRVVAWLGARHPIQTAPPVR